MDVERQKLVFSELLRPARSLIFDPVSDKGTLKRAKLFTFVFIRHPFERLVSAYTDKFVVNKNSQFINALRENDVQIGLMNENNISFEQFVNFVIDEISMDTMSEGSLHWWPYSSLCQMCEIDYSYNGNLEVRILLNLFVSLYI